MSRRSRPIVVLAVIAVGLAFINIWWLHRFRTGFPVNIDEAGYLTMALVDVKGWDGGGLTGLRHAFMSSHLQAPLVPLLASPLHALFGNSLAFGLILSVAMAAILMSLTYGLARTLTSARWALLGAVVVGTAPGIESNARDFHFALPLAVVLTGAVLALVRSEGLARTSWSLVGGILLGCVPLTRTMGLAFLPGPVAAVLVQVIVLPGRLKRVVNALLMTDAGVIVAYPWLHANYKTVYDYLQPGSTNPGVVGHKRALWLVALHDLVTHDLFVPLAAGILLAFLALASTLLTRPRRREGLSPDLGELARRGATWPGLVTLATLLEGWLALSVNNQSVAQWLPLIPCLVVLAVTSVAALRWVQGRVAFVIFFLAVALTNTISQTDLFDPLAGTVTVSVPIIGASDVVSGDSDIRQEIYNHSDLPLGPPQDTFPAADRKWTLLSRAEADYILAFARSHGAPPFVIFASRDALFNTNTVQLEGLLAEDDLISMGQLLANGGQNSVANYRRQLAVAPPGDVDLMVSVDNSPLGYQPPVNQAFAQQAASSLGYVEVQTFALPDGRQGRLWWQKR